MEGGGHAGPNITLQPLSASLLLVITFSLIDAQTGPFSANILTILLNNYLTASAMLTQLNLYPQWHILYRREEKGRILKNHNPSTLKIHIGATIGIYWCIVYILVNILVHIGTYWCILVQIGRSIFTYWVLGEWGVTQVVWLTAHVWRSRITP